jgi:hypothetical protein
MAQYKKQRLQQQEGNSLGPTQPRASGSACALLSQQQELTHSQEKQQLQPAESGAAHEAQTQRQQWKWGRRLRQQELWQQQPQRMLLESALAAPALELQQMLLLPLVVLPDSARWSA